MKDKNPLISVYTPTYNRAEILLARAIPSVLSQTYKNFEYIIVGDCCDDKTTAYISQIKDRRIKFYNLEKRVRRYPPTLENHWLVGPVVATNYALSQVAGKWIARIDDDDTWSVDHLQVLLNLARENDYEFVSSQYLEERFDEKRIIDGVRINSEYYTRRKNNHPDLGPKMGSTITWLYRSYLKFFKYNINCWRKTWNRNNDIDLSLRLYQAGVRMGFLDQVTAYVLPRPGEKSVGKEAYILTKKDKIKHFKFKQ